MWQQIATDLFLISVLAFVCLMTGMQFGRGLGQHRWRLIFLAIIAAAVLTTTALDLHIAYNQGKIDAFRQITGADDECRDAPKVVPYHDGMTLCPGQSAVVIAPIPLPAPTPIPPQPSVQGERKL